MVPGYIRKYILHTVFVSCKKRLRGLIVISESDLDINDDIKNDVKDDIKNDVKDGIKTRYQT
jgi:hypothetical protein